MRFLTNNFLFSLGVLFTFFGSSLSVKCYNYFSTKSLPAANYSEVIECFNGNVTVATCINLVFKYDDGTNPTTTYIAGCEQLFRDNPGAYCAKQRGNTGSGFEVISCNTCRAEDLCNKFEEEKTTTTTTTEAPGSAVQISFNIALVFLVLFMTI